MIPDLHTLRLLMRFWSRIKGKVDGETLRITLRLLVPSTCKNYIEKGKCKLLGLLPSGDCERCCLFCKDFLICQHSFSCPMIFPELVKLYKGYHKHDKST